MLLSLAISYGNNIFLNCYKHSNLTAKIGKQRKTKFGWIGSWKIKHSEFNSFINGMSKQALGLKNEKMRCTVPLWNYTLTSWNTLIEYVPGRKCNLKTVTTTLWVGCGTSCWAYFMFSNMKHLCSQCCVANCHLCMRIYTYGMIPQSSVSEREDHGRLE